MTAFEFWVLIAVALFGALILFGVAASSFIVVRRDGRRMTWVDYSILAGVVVSMAGVIVVLLRGAIHG